MSLIGNENETSSEETTSESTEETTTETEATTEVKTADDGVSTVESEVEFPEGLDAEISKDPSLQVFIKDGKINYANMMKSYVHAQKQMGKERVVIPDANASEEDKQAFFNKLGRPELDKYEIKSNVAEGQEVDTEMLEGFKQVAHESGMLPDQAQKVLAWFNTKSQEQGVTISDKNQAAYDEQLQGLKTEWGDAYDQNLKAADRALKEFASPEEIDYLVKAGIADDVNVVRLFSKISKGLAEDSFDQESHGSFGMSPADAQAKINSHMADANGPYLNSNHADHKRVVQEVAKLNAIIYK
jgi:Xaa-Pro aminopeptidase